MHLVLLALVVRILHLKTPTSWTLQWKMTLNETVIAQVCTFLTFYSCCLDVHGLLAVRTGEQSSQRTLRPVPRHFEDALPADEDVNPSESCGNNPLPVTGTQCQVQRVFLTLRDSLQTAFNVMGLCQQYPRRPSFEPDKFIPSSLLATSCPTSCDSHGTHAPDLPPEPPYPFPNMTIHRLMTWMNSGSLRKSETEVSRLVNDVIQAEDFNPRDLDGFSVRRSLRALDLSGGNETTTFPDDWQETDITLNIPTKSANESRSFDIRGFHY